MAIFTCNPATDKSGRELTDYSLPFPVLCFDDNIKKNPVPWHWHDSLEAGYITEGTAVLSICKEHFLLSPGEGFFVNSKALHQVADGPLPASRLRSVVFHPRLIGGTVDSIFWQEYLTPLLSPSSPQFFKLDAEAVGLLSAAWEACEKETPGYEFQVRALLSRLVFLLVGRLPENKTAASGKTLRDNERIKAMLRFIDSHYSEPLDTAGIAASAAVSKSECLRCFHSTIGTTPIQYLRKVRLQRAAELLLTSSRKVVDIGLSCGFTEMSYFARAFRELYGCTPTEYRERTAGKG